MNNFIELINQSTDIPGFKTKTTLEREEYIQAKLIAQVLNNFNQEEIQEAFDLGHHTHMYFTVLCKTIPEKFFTLMQKEYSNEAIEPQNIAIGTTFKILKLYNQCEKLNIEIDSRWNGLIKNIVNIYLMPSFLRLHHKALYFSLVSIAEHIIREPDVQDEILPDYLRTARTNIACEMLKYLYRNDKNAFDSLYKKLKAN